MHFKSIHQAKTHLSQLIEKVLQGEDVVICKAGNPLVKLIPYQKLPVKRIPGLWKGKIHIQQDFDAFLEDF